MDIEIDRPIRISLDILELDEHVPSIKVSVKVKVFKFNYCLSTSTDVWFECCVFDKFVSSLKRKENSILVDVEMNFRLEVDFSGKSISWMASRKDLNERITLAEGSESITDHELSFFVESFGDYPKWW